MTRKSFLRKLSFSLFGEFNAKEKRDIINDYKGFFEHGLSNGVPESATLSDLGDPVDIAINLSRESGKGLPVGAFILTHIGKIYPLCGMFIFIISTLVFHNTIFNQIFRNRRYAIILSFDENTLIIVAVICLMLMNVSLYLIFRTHMKVFDLKRISGLFTSNIVILALTVLYVIFFHTEASAWLAVQEPLYITNFYLLGLRRISITGLGEIRLLCIFFAACIGLRSALKIYKGKPEEFVTIVRAVGASVYL